MSPNKESEQLAALNEFETALEGYKDIIARGGGDIEEARPRLRNALLGCVACDALDTKTRNEPLIGKGCERSMKELSKCLTKLFPPSAVSVARRNQALINAKEVFDKWSSHFGIGHLPEQAEKEFSKNLSELGAEKGAVFVGTVTILTEFEHLNEDFEDFLRWKLVESILPNIHP
ncbi:hypothetical protein DL98DRAFT_522336, partial [Cadophora sp. DSE1049]